MGTGLGRKYTLVTHSPVNDRQKYKFKGDYDNGTLSLKMAKATLVATDAGQTLLQAAAASDASYSFNIHFQDGSDMYFTAKCMGFMTDMGTINNILSAGAELQIDSVIVETT